MRVALRALLRRPSFALPAVLVLALGVGATLTLFGFVQGVFLEPLPYPDAGRLVWLRERHADVPARPISYPTFLDWQARNDAFDAIAAVRDVRMRWTTGSQARVLDAGLVTADYFTVLGVPPRLGRDFAAPDDAFGAAGVAIVSHGFAEVELGGAAESLGAELVLDDTAHTVVGVAPAGLVAPGDPDVWVPMGRRAAPDTGWTDRSVRIAGFAVARLRPGRTIAQARADMARVQAGLAGEHPQHVAGHEVEMLSLRQVLVGDVRLPLLLGFAAVGVLLVLVCVNVSNLLLLRVLDRRRELALRAALGAGRGRIVADVLREGLLVAAFGTALGVGLALFGTRLLAWPLSEYLFAGMSIGVDAGVIAFAVLLAAAVGVATSALPAWRGASAELGAALGAGTRTAGPAPGRVHTGFVAFQTALAVVLLISAALLVTSMARILASDPGFDKHGVATFRLSLPGEYAGPERLNGLYAQLVRELGAVTGVRSAAVFNELPGLEPTWQSDIAPRVGGEYRRRPAGELINVDWRIVSAGYFDVMGIRVERGRAFTDAEAEQGAPVMLIDESLAARFWPDGDAVGNHIRYDGPTDIEIIGIARNVHAYGDASVGRITIYTPYGRFPYLGNVGVALRADGVDPGTLVGPARDAVRSIDARIALVDVATLDRALERRLAPRMLTTWVIGLFAVFAALLAALGVYTVMSYVVGRQQRELGVRVALGAAPRHVAGRVIVKGVRASAAGVAVGLPAALGAGRLLSGVLFDVGYASPAIYAAVAVLSLAAAAAACALPAWRAARRDPLPVLRAD